MTLAVSAREVRRALVVLAVAVPSLSLAVVLASRARPLPAAFVQLLDVNGEMNLPAWYSSLGLAASAALLALAAAGSAGEAYVLHWLVLAFVFALLSADEMAGVHEELGALLRNRFHLSGYLRHAWVLPAFAALAALGAAYLRFLGSLPSRTRWSFVVAGSIYVGGAAGVEMIGGKLVDVYGDSSLQYALCTHLEELLELLGIALFNAALLEHLARVSGPEGVRLRLAD